MVESESEGQSTKKHVVCAQPQKASLAPKGQISGYSYITHAQPSRKKLINHLGVR